MQRNSMENEVRMLKKILLLNAVPASKDAGLLALRLIAATTFLLKYGLERYIGFPDHVHFPVLPPGSMDILWIALLVDIVCTVLMILGLATRWAALISLLYIGYSWSIMHHFEFWGEQAVHSEVVIIYMSVMVALILAGPGKYSIEGKLLNT
jgi:putative oxidoreductase